MISAANSAPIPWVVQRPQPTFGPMNPTATPISAHSERQSVSAPRPLTQAGSSTAQARISPRAATSARTTQPSSGRRMASLRPLITRRPRQGACGGPGRPWRSGTPRARDAGPAIAGAEGPAPAASPEGSNADASRATTTVLIPRFLSAASGRMNEVSADGVMTIAVMPRRSRPRLVRSASSSGVRPSASTAASNWRILRRWRAPRSAGSTVSRWPLTVSPTARFSPNALSAMDAAARTATSVVESSPDPASRAASRSRKIQASAVCSRSNSLTWISPRRAVVRQWMRFMESPGAYGRTVVASGVVWRVRSGEACAPSMLAGGSRHRGRASTRG